MSPTGLGFVSFEPTNGEFQAFLSIDAAFSGDHDPQTLVREATEVYERVIDRMRLVVGEIKALRRTRTPIPARKVWQVGDLVFRLRDELATVGLQVDGVYDHLARDLAVKRKWLEKVIILRRYIEDIAIIPKELNWGRCEKGTARIARRLSDGLPPE